MFKLMMFLLVMFGTAWLVSTTFTPVAAAVLLLVFIVFGLVSVGKTVKA